VQGPPGHRFAENSIWIAVTTILYCFEIKTAGSENGVGTEPPVDFDGFAGSAGKKLYIDT
jgi:hypothetical protein